MPPKGPIVAVFLVITLLAIAGGVEAKGGHGKAPSAGPPEHAKAHGHAKHADPAPAASPPSTPAPTDTPPTSDQGPATQAPSAPAPAPAAGEAPTPIATSPHPKPGASLGATPLVTAPTSESRIEARTAAFGAGAATTRAPGWAGDAFSPPASSDSPARAWWVHLAWALPLAGIGGVAAVLVARQRTRTPPEAAAAERDVGMITVSPDDLKGILQNGHAAAARGAYRDAVAWFERALSVSPTLGVAYFCKGVCLAASGQVSDAYGALRTACTVEPEDATYRVHFARVAVTLGKHKEAMDALELVARTMPELGTAMLEDSQLAGLRDHPRFLMICGAL